jgi:hypothetical protein
LNKHCRSNNDSSDTTLTDKPDQPDLTPSICEEALANFSKSDDSLAGVIEENHIELRDFMILSFICDQNAMSVEQICGALGLSRHSTIDCVGRLMNAGLIDAAIVDDAHASTNRVVPTGAGRTLARRILGN